MRMPARFSLLLLLATLAASASAALVREEKLPSYASGLPSVTVTSNGSDVTWSMFKVADNDVDEFGIYRLGKTHAQVLKMAARRADDSYAEIKAAGRCPSGVVRGGQAGVLGGGSSDKITFEVVCERNNIMVEVVMTDEYVVNFIRTKVEASALHKLADKLLTYYPDGE